jgi:hypothetical protein
VMNYRILRLFYTVRRALATKMKKLALTALFILLASPAWANTYFLAPASGGGNDSNNGTSASSPWLSPNHAVNCGDTIIAAASASYSSSEFGSGKWGPVACAGGNNVAWLACATFDACKITSSSSHAMIVSASYWGVQGWETSTNSGSSYGCFVIQSAVHHIIFANDIANGCTGGGFTSFNIGNASADYIVYVGDIAYNSAQGGGACFSGFNVYQPQNHDTAPGTHIYVAGNFAYANTDPSPCAGGSPTDGEGIIMDTFDGSQGGLSPYTQQAVVYNNITFGNGGRGVEVFNNSSGSSHANIYLEYNTTWNDNNATNQNWSGCGEIQIGAAQNVTAMYNLAMASTSTGCGNNQIYAFSVENSNGTATVNNNWGHAAAGTTGFTYNSSGFSYGAGNAFGTNPNFSSPSIPGAPNCGSATSVPNCMATVISHFAPTASGSAAYGYHIPQSNDVTDPLFPQWLCNVNLPAGLVTLGCASSTSLPDPPTNIKATVQ